MGAGPAIEDDQRAVVAPHLNTRRVAAVAQRDSTRLGQGSAGTLKPDIHPCTLARLKGAAPKTVGTTPVPALPQQLVSRNEQTTTTRPPLIVVWLVPSVKRLPWRSRRVNGHRSMGRWQLIIHDDNAVVNKRGRAAEQQYERAASAVGTRVISRPPRSGRI